MPAQEWTSPMKHFIEEMGLVVWWQWRMLTPADDQQTHRPTDQPTSQPTTERPIVLVVVTIAGAPVISHPI